MTPEQRLFQAVVNRAFEDATSSADVLDLERAQARRWLLRGGKDFAHVCLLAGYDPEYIRGKAERLAKAGWPVLFKKIRDAEAA